MTPIRKFKIAGKVVTFFSGAKASARTWRVGILNPAAIATTKLMAKTLSNKSVGRVRDILVKRNLAAEAGLGAKVVGVVAGAGKKKKAYINVTNINLMKGLPGNKNLLRETVNHELFHTKRIIGNSEVAAHFWGGLHSVKNKLSFKVGADRVKMFAKVQPGRTAIEAATAAGTLAAAGATAAGGTYVFRRIRGRVVRIKVKEGQAKK